MADWNSQSLAVTFLFPNVNSPLSAFNVVANGVGVADNFEGLTYVLSATYVAPNVEQLAFTLPGGTQWYGAAFNGIEIAGPASDSPIVSVSLVSALPEPVYLSSTASAVYLNFANFLTGSGAQTIAFDVTFAAVAPTLTAVAPSPIESGQSLVIGAVAAGVAGDTLSVRQTAGSGAVTLGAVVNGVENVIYTAPAGSLSGTADVAYTVTETQTGGSVAGASDITFDPGPILSAVAPSPVQSGQTIVIGVVSPGLAGDVLSVKQSSGSGAVSLGAVRSDGTQQVLYTAPATIGADATDTVGYQIFDAHKDVSAPGVAAVSLEVTPSALGISVASIDGAPTQRFNALAAGHVITLALALDEPLTVTGAPTLSLSNGGVAQYVSGSGTSQLLFAYKIAATDASTAALTATGLGLAGGAALTDANGLTLATLGALPALANLQIQTAPPALMSATIDVARTLGVGAKAVISLTFSEPVAVTGAGPTLSLNDGAAATFAAVSADGRSLLFDYTVAAGDKNVAALAVSAVNLNGAMVADLAGNAADFTGALTSFAGVGVQTTPPTAAAPIATSDNGASDLDAGHVITILVPFSEAVIAQNNPTLDLGDGRRATFVGGVGGDVLRFQYTVAPGDNVADLHVLGLATGAIVDLAGNLLANTIEGDLGLTLDTTAPVVKSLTFITDNGAADVGAGHVVTICVEASEPLFVDQTHGAATLNLSDGAQAIYVSGSGTATLTFAYTVGAGDDAADLAVAGLANTGAVIADAAGNALGAVSGALGLSIDTTTPAILGVSATTDNHAADLDAGHVVTITLTTSRPVFVDLTHGSPTLALTGGLSAAYVGGSGTTALIFTCTVAAGDNVGDLRVTGLSLNGAVVAGGAGTALTGSAAADLGLTLDTTPPVVSAIAAQTDTGALALDAGHFVTITLTLSEPVTVDLSQGSPTLTLNDGRSASLFAGPQSATLQFIYQVMPGDSASDLSVTGLALNGATLRDAAGNALSGPVQGALGLSIDTTAPVTLVSAAADAGPLALGPGRVVTITLQSDKPLFASGSAGLTLNDGGVANLVSGAGGETLTFSYLVGAQANAADLGVSGAFGLADQAGNSASPSGALGLVVDTTAPTATVSAAVNAGPAGLGAGRTVTITFDASKPVYVDTANGGPRLRLNDGEEALYAGGSGTASLTFVYQVAAGDNIADLKVTGLDVSNGGVVDDAGNALGPVAADLDLDVDTAAPSATLTAATDSGATDLNAGHVVSITLASGEPVYVDTTLGAPTLKLNDGGVAIYQGGSGADALTFAYTVAAGQNISDLQVTGLVANGAHVGDVAGNPFAPVAGDLKLAVDTQTPVFATLASSQTKALPGQTVTLTITMSEAVSVSGGVPTLTLSDGGVATYDAAATATLGDATRLVFDYPVSFDQATTGALTVVALALNGASIVDGAGNAASFAGLTGAAPGLAVDSDIDWNGGTGLWTNAADWSSGFVPGANNTVNLTGAKGGDITVGAPAAVRALTVANAATLLRVDSNLAVSGALTTAGLILLDDGIVTASGGLTVAPGGVLDARGVANVAGDVVNNSQGLAGAGFSAGLEVTGDLYLAGSLSGTGSTYVGGQLEVAGAVTQTLAFAAGGGATIRLDDPADAGGAIANVANGSFVGDTNQTVTAADVIDLAGVDPDAVHFDGQKLTGVTQTGAAFSIALSGADATSLADATFASVSDGAGGAAVRFVAGLQDTWTGGASGDFLDASKWSLGFAPGPYDQAVIGGSAATNIAVAAGESATANQLVIGAPDVTLTVNGALQLNATPQLDGATLDIAGGSLQLVNLGDLDNGAVTLDGGFLGAASQVGSLSPVPASLTLGPTLTVTQLGAVSSTSTISSDDTIVNQGRIVADVAGGALNLQIAAPPAGSPASLESISNSGEIDVGDGETLTAGGGFNQTFQFNNSGAITIGAHSFATLGASGWSNSGTISVGAGATLTLDGSYDASDLAGIVNQGGTVVLNGAPVGVANYQIAGGAFVVNPDYTTTNPLNPPANPSSPILNAQFTIASGASLEFQGDPQAGVYTSGTVSFAGPGAELKLDALAWEPLGSPGPSPDFGDFVGSIENVQDGDSLDFVGQTITGVSDGGGELVVTGPAGQAYLFASPAFDQDSLQLSSDGAGGTRLTFVADTTPPAITAVAATTDNGATDIGAGRAVTITLTLREPVLVTGAPTLRLNDGGVASYVSGDGTTSLTFVYQTQSGQNVANLAITGLDFSQGAINDTAGNPLSATYAASLGLQIDTQAPFLVRIDAPVQVVTTGGTELITLDFSEAVTLSGGVPTLTLDNGGEATFDAAATAKLADPTKLVFAYTVGAVNNTEASVTITGVALNGATLADGAGNAADLSAAVGRNLAFGVDTAPPSTPSGPVYFIADAGAGNQVWTSQGAKAVTAPGGYAAPDDVVATSDGVYFLATDSGGNQGLFEVAGTQATELTNYPGQSAGEYVSATAVVGDELLLFVMQSATSSGSFGPNPPTLTLYTTDGASAPTAIQTFGADTVLAAPPAPLTTGGRVYFLAPDSSGGQWVWETDGTSASELPTSYNDPAYGSYLSLGYASSLSLSDDLLTINYSGGQIVFDTTAQQYLTPNLAHMSGVQLGGDTYSADGVLVKTDAGGTQTLIGSGLFYDPQNLTVSGATLFFTATDAGTGKTALFATHGSDATTTELTAADGSVLNLTQFTPAGGKLFFTAWDPSAYATRLFVSDGTAAGTLELGGATDPTGLVANGGAVYFSATDPTHGRQLWTSDGTAAGTKIAASVATGATPTSSTVELVGHIGGDEILAVYDPATTDYVLERTDGTAAGTQPIVSAGGVAPDYGAAFNHVQQFGPDGDLYFLSSTPVGDDLWRTDGTSAGTVDLGAASGFAFGGSQLYVSTQLANGGGLALYAVDPATGARTAIPAPSGVRFTALAPTAAGAPLYVSGSDGGLYEILADAAAPVANSQGLNLTSDVAFGGALYGFSSTGSAATLYALNGASASALATFSGDAPGPLQVAGSSLFFTLDDNLGDPVKLYRSDGTAAGTQAVALPSSAYIFGNTLVGAGDHLFVLGQDHTTGNVAVYAAPASGGAAIEVTDGAQSAQSYDYAVSGDDLYFSMGGRLWVSAGQSDDARQVTGAYDNIAYTAPFVLGANVYFYADDDATGALRLWSVASGGATATQVDLGASSPLYGPGAFDSLNGGLVFDGFDANGHETVFFAKGGGVTQVSSFLFPQSSNPASIAALPANVTPQSGKAVDGYIAGATVFADANGDGKWEPGEALTTTDANGNFTLVGGAGPLVLLGGTDTITGLANTTSYTAPAGSTVVTPLTTLVQALVADGSSVANAQAQVATAFNLPSLASTLTTFDPVAATLAGNAAGAAAFAAGAEVADVIALVASALGTSPTSSSTSAQASVAQTLAGAVASATGTLDLGDAAVIGGIVDAAATAGGATLDSAYLADIAQVTAASNQTLQSLTLNATSPTAALQSAGGVQLVAQGQTAPAIGDGASGQTLTQTYTGAALNTAVGAASNEVSVPCFLRGTRILTERGEVAVERLRVGDRIMTASGGLRPVVWLGARRVDPADWRRPEEVWPVRFAAGAFGGDCPHSDLWLSPGHNLALDGWLIPASALLNGVSVQQVDLGEVEYWHVELDEHDILLAHGLPAESYLDTGNRSSLLEAGADIAAPAAAARHWSETCLPLAREGEPVARARRRLETELRRRGYEISHDPRAWLEVEGRRLAPTRTDDGLLRFELPEPGREIVLGSRWFIPALTRPDNPDPRRLGLCVRRLMVDDIELPLEDDAHCGEGWHGAETDGERFARRWTRDPVRLPPAARAVVLELAGPGFYLQRAGR